MIRKDPYERFKPLALPPAKNGDYAYLLHIFARLKAQAKAHAFCLTVCCSGAIPRPRSAGILFARDILKESSDYRPTFFMAPEYQHVLLCWIRKDAQTRKGIFMIDASKGFMKDGNKNRLRDQDIHKIVDVLTRQARDPEIFADGLL